MPKYNMVAQTTESTVLAEYTPEASKSDAYQSEAALEAEFVRILQSLGYDYLKIHEEADLIINLRAELEKLNDFTFTANEWDRFFHEKLANPNESIVEKTRKIQEDYVQVLIRDDGSTMNVKLIDKKNIHNNHTQVINQYVNNEGNYDNRYDVTVLVNGLPMVHIELKRRGVELKEAFNQINRYQRDSFWAGNGLYEYVQIFVISNGTFTKYYSNTTRDSHIKQSVNGQTGKKTSNSFEFTSYWADASNKIIPDLVDFAKTFFARHTILAILTKYCVFTSEELLLVMRPYQIAATERIINRIEISNNYKQMQGTIDAGGFIWHTTGSGKTLTSFKTAQIASKLSDVDKVLFVVDRKDLDYQTMKEYERFEKGCANGNSSTAILQRQLENKDSKGNPHDYPIIVTTIQKLSNFVSRNKTHPVYNQHIVIIFDECHRNQFGDMHNKIVKSFKKYNIFGFTGTPIFAENASRGKHIGTLTTKQTFGACLHTYTIVDAINDGNVLPFRVDYINTVKEKDDIRDKKVPAIDIERAMMAPERISKIVDYTLEHFDQKTKRNSAYSVHGKRLHGFNSIFACASIPAAKLYYNEFKKQIAQKGNNLVIATIFSYATNEADSEDVEGFLSEEEFETDALDKPSRDFLESCIQDYNIKFNTNFDTSADKFQNYYKDVSQRTKNREIDILIVVNMFLTGFDATTLNTLWVDKNLKQHGLIQAFSRTNRILNSVKTFGNIVCFRNLQQQVDEAVALFGDKDAGGIITLKNYDAYYNGYDDDKGKHHDGYIELIEQINELCPPGQLPFGEEEEKLFIKLYSGILSVRNILSAFDQFEGDTAMSARDLQNYQSIYLMLYDKYRKQRPDADKENINDDIVFEIELIKQVDINIDYILRLVLKMHGQNCEDKEIVAAVQKVVDSSLNLRSKKALIEQFILDVNITGNIEQNWKEYVTKRAEEEFMKIVTEENLKEKEARAFVDKAFKEGAVRETGTDIVGILPSAGRFGNNNLASIKQRVLEKLKEFFNMFFGLGIFETEEEETTKELEPDVSKPLAYIGGEDSLIAAEDSDYEE